jgi:hypothetical protein
MAIVTVTQYVAVCDKCEAKKTIYREQNIPDNWYVIKKSSSKITVLLCDTCGALAIEALKVLKPILGMQPVFDDRVPSYIMVTLKYDGPKMHI